MTADRDPPVEVVPPERPDCNRPMRLSELLQAMGLWTPPAPEPVGPTLDAETFEVTGG